MPRSSSFHVPVIPNASRVRGRITRVHPDPDGPGTHWLLTVAGAEDVSGYPNFAADRVGKCLSVYVPPGAPAVAAGDEVEAQLTFRGDEWGGSFAVVDDDVHKL